MTNHQRTITAEDSRRAIENKLNQMAPTIRLTKGHVAAIAASTMTGRHAPCIIPTSAGGSQLVLVPPDTTGAGRR